MGEWVRVRERMRVRESGRKEWEREWEWVRENESETDESEWERDRVRESLTCVAIGRIFSVQSKHSKLVNHNSTGSPANNEVVQMEQLLTDPLLHYLTLFSYTLIALSLFSHTLSYTISLSSHTLYLTLFSLPSHTLYPKTKSKPIRR